ncbi:coiled-coil domain-containing protein 91-like [Lineus longissimus]|uniref:coiled-coil domain-containing protein 91-like n=1 Tax=Lineus longissimus TaxID=88925 RepID=UPI002B4F5F33
MSTIVLRKTRDPLDHLSRMLNKTTLTTQRVGHENVMTVGSDVLSKVFTNKKDDRQKEIDDAVEAAEKRAARELRAAMKRLRHELEDDKQRALDAQKLYYTKLAKKVNEQRDKLEEERVRELLRKCEKEKQEALQAQWEECERLKEEAIKDALATYSKKLRNEFALERERAIAEALHAQKIKFQQRLQATVEATIAKCQQDAAEEAARVAVLHQQETDELNRRYDILTKKYKRELDHKMRLERDFFELQTDYKRFMDYTGGQYNSDYMMRLRKYGLQLSDRRISQVTYKDIEEDDESTDSFINPLDESPNCLTHLTRPSTSSTRRNTLNTRPSSSRFRPRTAGSLNSLD